ncbi:MAG TPA: hypothetical protein VGI16_09015 [Candidatus Acidoferrum sp.]|jgi:hypothetical protein
MKIRLTMGLAAMLFAGLIAVAANSSFTGYIADSKCNVQAAHDGARECTIKCVKEGAKYVFVSDGDKKVYAIDDQAKVAEHAGHHVTVTGTVDGDSMKLSSIEMVPAKK